MLVPHQFKSAARHLAGRAYQASPHFLSHLRGKVLILMYHRVIPHGDVDETFVQPGMYVTPKTFALHLRYLTTYFELLSFGQLLDRWQSGAWDDDVRYCAITFDDGWVDNYQYAYPLLRAYKAPATIFLPTRLIGTHAWLWSDRLGRLLRGTGQHSTDEVDRTIERAKALSDSTRDRLLEDLQIKSHTSVPRARRFLNWDEVREMARHGVSFGSHTATHAQLPRLDEEALVRELREPLHVLHQHCPRVVDVLAYPNGDHSAHVIDAAQAAGYRAAVTTNPGTESGAPTDRYRLKRVGLHEDVTHTVPLMTFHIARQIWSA